MKASDLTTATLTAQKSSEAAVTRDIRTMKRVTTAITTVVTVTATRHVAAELTAETVSFSTGTKNATGQILKKTAIAQATAKRSEAAATVLSRIVMNAPQNMRILVSAVSQSARLNLPALTKLATIQKTVKEPVLTAQPTAEQATARVATV